MAALTWLILFYELSARSSTQRVYVWRKLKSAGVVYWKDSVCLLPDRPELREQLTALQKEILERGGEATLSTIQFPLAKEQASMAARFRQQADDEYQEFLGQCRDYHAELAKERKHKHFTFPELEENSVELEKLRGWLVKTEARDFFTGKLQKQARQAFLACEKDFDVFSNEVARIAGGRAITARGRKKTKD